MAIYKEKPSIEVLHKPTSSISSAHSTKIRTIVTNFITHLKAAL